MSPNLDLTAARREIELHRDDWSRQHIDVAASTNGDTSHERCILTLGVVHVQIDVADRGTITVTFREPNKPERVVTHEVADSNALSFLLYRITDELCEIYQPSQFRHAKQLPFDLSMVALVLCCALLLFSLSQDWYQFTRGHCHLKLIPAIGDSAFSVGPGVYLLIVTVVATGVFALLGNRFRDLTFYAALTIVPPFFLVLCVEPTFHHFHYLTCGLNYVFTFPWAEAEAAVSLFAILLLAYFRNWNAHTVNTVSYLQQKRRERQRVRQG